MVRQTSISIYKQIEAEGLLTKRRLEVYSTLFRFGPMTSNECFKKMKIFGMGSHTTSSNSCTRFTELRDRGVIYEVRTRPCKITGVNVIEWDVTSKLPIDPPKKEKRIKCEHCDGKGYVR